MNKELAEMIQKDLRVARRGWAETVEELDKLLLIDFEKLDDSVIAKAIEAARSMKEKALVDSTMSHLAFLVFNEMTK